MGTYDKELFLKKTLLTDFKEYSDEQLKVLSSELKKRAGSEAPEALLPEAFALVCETAYRTIGERPFETQVKAAVAMHFECVAQLKTGEGKTLAATMPAYLNALSGKSVHILTFNDYLAKRDALWMAPIYEFLGLSFGYISASDDSSTRRETYKKDIVYITAKEAGFDYLRDFLALSPDDIVHRSLDFAIVDEADSILIDEARIPLVIAGSMPEEQVSDSEIAEIAAQLEPDHVKIEQDSNTVFLTEKGLLFAEEKLEIENLYDEENFTLLTRVNNAVHAQFMLVRDKDYIVKNGEIKIVDEFTGRIADNRHYPEGMQMAVENKEGLAVKERGTILDQITIQHFIENYSKIAGMTGTAEPAKDEFYEMYKLEVEAIPTYKTCIRIDNPDLCFTHREAKLNAALDLIESAHAKGQPVLIGTISVMESEEILAMLQERGMKNINLLNAKNDEMEAEIISKAGYLNSLTVSTNMAGRGVDIKLGEGVPEVGGLLIVGINRNDSMRIDDQLRGRAGRQGDVGESRFFVALDDPIMLKYNIRSLVPEYEYPENTDAPIENKTVLREMQRIQKISEGAAFDARKSLLRFSSLNAEQRKIVFEWRTALLKDERQPKLDTPEQYAEMPEENMLKAKKKLLLYFINRHWSDFIDYMAYVKEGIHLNVVGGKNPIDEYHRTAIESFKNMREQIIIDANQILETAEISPDGEISLEKEGLNAPAATWTYLLDESVDQFSALGRIVKSFTNQVKGALFSVTKIFGKRDKN